MLHFIFYQAIHLIIFAHIGIAHLCSELNSAAVATGVGNTLGNKGGVGISLKIGATKLVFVNAHLAAHQNAVKQRNADYHKIAKEIPYSLFKKSNVNRLKNTKSSFLVASEENNNNNIGSTGNGSSPISDPLQLVPQSSSEMKNNGDSKSSNESPKNNIEPQGNTPTTNDAVMDSHDSNRDDDDSNRRLLTDSPKVVDSSNSIEKVGKLNRSSMFLSRSGAWSGFGESLELLPFEKCADRVVFMGDLNYRIRGNRYESGIKEYLNRVFLWSYHQ